MAIVSGEGASHRDALRRMSNEQLSNNVQFLTSNPWWNDPFRYHTMLRLRNEMLDEIGRRIGDWEMWGMK